MANNRKFLFVNTDQEIEEEQLSVTVSTGATDSHKLATLDTNGQWDASLINASGIDHGGLAGLGDDDHPQYILVDGTRAFTGDQSLGGFKITNLADPTAASDAANKQYVDAVAQGLYPKGNVRVASTAAVNLASAPSTIDGVTLSNGDRVLIKDGSTTNPGVSSIDNGIYVFNGAGSAMTRSADQDNSPLAEILNGVFIPQVLEGTTNAGVPYFISSVGSGTDGVHTIGVDAIQWDIFTSPSQLTAGDGISITSNVVAVDLTADSGLEFSSGDLQINFADTSVAGDLDGTNGSLAIKAEDLSGNGANQGANIIGADPSTIGLSSSTDVQGVLEDLSAAIGGVTFTAGVAIDAADLLYISANDTVSPLPITGGPSSEYGIGLATASASASASVSVASNDTVITGVLGALTPTAGDKIYWDGSGLTTSAPTGSGSLVWQVGIAKNATDLYVEVLRVKRNA